jgi:sigma-B regulation protein RsbU (phosphoserine phosphatase)
MADQNQKISSLEDENKRLRTAVEELSILNDITGAITSTQTVEKIIDLIVQKCVKHLNVEQGAVMLLDELDANRPFHTLVRKQDSIMNGLPYRLDTQLTGWMLLNKAPLFTNDLFNDKRFSWGDEKSLSIHSLLCVPMLVKGKMIGLITVFNKKSAEGFQKEDQRLLSIIAAQSGQVLENARLYQKEQALIRFQEEMRLAGDIQHKLLPSKAPQIPGYEIMGKSNAAKYVGGDYFDFIPIDNQNIAICLGDVSGKGIPAALLMANLQATLRGQTAPEKSTNMCLERSNKLIYESTDEQKFATLFYARLNFINHKLCYCNGGHDKPYLMTRSGDVKRLGTGGIPLGFLPSYPYEEERIDFNPGDMLIIYSDGITEAMNLKEEEFGEDRLEKIISANPEEKPEELIDLILKEIDAHVGKAPQMDDQTMVVLKRIS